MDFKKAISEGIPDRLPAIKLLDPVVSHAPKRKDVLSMKEKKLAVRNALRYFPKEWHAELSKEFIGELRTYGRIYMYRFRPDYKMCAHPIEAYPAKCQQAAAIMLMIQNNLDSSVAQHPHELITYGGNGAVFQNWAQYRLTMRYLSEMTGIQTLVMYSGHPLGLFPSSKDAPRVVVTNGMMIPNYSRPDDWEKFNALGVTQYGQMTAGSFMYIGPQGIVHGTTITLLNAIRKIGKEGQSPLFVTSGLGGMSGAQPKAAKIAGAVSICAEINPAAAVKRQQQGWVDEVIDDLDRCIETALMWQQCGTAHSIAYLGNAVDLWERLALNKIPVDMGSDQTSLHNPWAGGYYPAALSYDESNRMMVGDPSGFKDKVQQSLRRQVKAINVLADAGMYFFDYGNAFLLESGRAGAAVFKEADKGAVTDKKFRYPSYVQDIMGPICFDHGFGPFRWVCTSGRPEDLKVTDKLAANVLAEMLEHASDDISGQLSDNLHWVQEAEKNELVVGSQARILYADAEGRIGIASAFNRAVADGRIGPVVIGRDHHDVSGTDSPFRETSNIYDGSSFTADMAVQNFVGDGFRGATWISLHNGGGVGWGEVVNGGFGLLLDGTDEAEVRLRSMLHWDVNNGIARRSWARNPGARCSAEKAMQKEPALKITLPNLVDDALIDDLDL